MTSLSQIFAFSTNDPSCPDNTVRTKSKKLKEMIINKLDRLDKKLPSLVLTPEVSKLKVKQK